VNVLLLMLARTKAAATGGRGAGARERGLLVRPRPAGSPAAPWRAIR
jgi:hypothetical protein